MDRWRDDRERKSGKKQRKETQERQSGRSQGTCAAVNLSFNPLGFFLPPFPTFSVLIDKHRGG